MLGALPVEWITSRSGFLGSRGNQSRAIWYSAARLPYKATLPVYTSRTPMESTCKSLHRPDRSRPGQDCKSRWRPYGASSSKLRALGLALRLVPVAPVAFGLSGVG